MITRLSCTALFALAPALACAQAGDAPSTTPYRPSVSTPAALSAPGWLEVEMGGQYARADDPSHQSQLPYTLKLAFSPDWGLRLGGTAWIDQTNADGSRARDGGDTNLVLKRRFAIDDASAFGLEASAKVPTAGRSLGSGHADYGLNAIYSTDLQGGAWHVDLNLAPTRLGGVDGASGESAWQTLWAGALSHTLNDRASVVGEFSGTRQHGAPATAQWLMAASYNVSRAVTWDIGLSKGLNQASGHWAVFSGVTFLAARLF